MYNQSFLTQYIDSNAIFRLCFFFCIAIGILSTSDIALAADADVFGSKMCVIIKMIQGTTGKVVATIAIIGAGAGALTGNLRWPTVIITIAGIIIFFSAPALVGIFTGEDMANFCK